MSLIQFLRILMARRAIMLAALLSCFAVAMVISQLLPPRYQARSRIILDIVKPDPVTGQLISTQFLRAYTRTQIELIKDYRTAGQVVDQLGWTNDPGFIAQYAADTDGEGTDIRRWAAQRIIDGTNAQLIESSNILEITYTGTSADSARAIADMIRTAYIQESLQARREAASRTADWYRDQTDKALLVLTAAEKARTDFARENGIVLQAGNTDLESSKLAALSQQTAIPMPSFAGAAGPPPAALQLDQINQQLAQAATTLGPNHPVFQSLQRQRAIAEAEMRRQMAAQSGMAPGGSSAGQIESAYQAQKSRVLAQRDKIDQLNLLQSDIDLKRDQYQKAAQRAAELRLEADVAETGLDPLGNAVAPEKPSFPNVPLIAFGSIGLGLGLGICLALLIEMLGRRVRSDDDLEGAAKAPVFAIIGDRRDPDGWVRKIMRILDRKSRRHANAMVEA